MVSECHASILHRRPRVGMMPVIRLLFGNVFRLYWEVWYTGNMNIKIKLFASLRQLGPDEQVAEFPDGTTIDDVVHAVKIPGTIRLLMIVNGEHRPADHVLKDGDELALFPPIAGGRLP